MPGKTYLQLRGVQEGDMHYIDLNEVNTINDVGGKVLITSGHHSILTIEPIAAILRCLPKGTKLIDCAKVAEVMAREALAKPLTNDFEY
jgi:hypothetical protein